MKRFVFSITLIFLLVMTYGQTNVKAYDSLLVKTIQKQIGFPYSRDGLDSTGVALIMIFKVEDSLALNIVYASGVPFMLVDDKGLRQRLNKYRDEFPNSYSVMVPLHFDFYKEGDKLVPLNVELKKVLIQKVKEFGERNHILKFISIPGYQIVR